jgi:threonine dehydrogenase-like Zn-dependent dehydrogenase
MSKNGSVEIQAVAVCPGRKNSARLVRLPKPKLSADDRNKVLVKVLAVGVDGTDKEILAAEYGAPPAGDEFLITGHESFGIVEETGSEVIGLRPGDFVVATVRRPGSSLYDAIGAYDMTTDDTYFERGINLRHGFLTEYYIEEPEYLVKVPAGLKDVAVLLEPTSIVEKGIAQAFEIQRRLRVWRPRKAAVLGAGTIGLLATMALRARGLEVHTFSKTEKPYRNADLIEEVGAAYHSTNSLSVRDGAAAHGPFDIIFEATGYSPIVFEAMEALGKNGVLILSSVTGGNRTAEVPTDKINLGFVLGNKVMVGTVNANSEYFEIGVNDFSKAQLTWPGWLQKLLTHRVSGLENFEQLLMLLTNGKDVIKAYCEVARI